MLKIVSFVLIVTCWTVKPVNETVILLSKPTCLLLMGRHVEAIGVISELAAVFEGFTTVGGDGVSRLGSVELSKYI